MKQIGQRMVEVQIGYLHRRHLHIGHIHQLRLLKGNQELGKRQENNNEVWWELDRKTTSNIYI